MGTREDRRGRAGRVRQSRTGAHASSRLVGGIVSFPSWKRPEGFTHIGIDHKEFLILQFRNGQIPAISYDRPNNIGSFNPRDSYIKFRVLRNEETERNRAR